jgi:4-hydroxybenzoate polyprenyltransferase
MEPADRRRARRFKAGSAHRDTPRRADPLETPDSLPLVIDLDGTMLRSDLLIESALSHVRSCPGELFHPLYWLLHGKAYLKERLATQITIDPAMLPYNEPLMDFVRQARAEGRKIVLATASHRIFADQVAAHLDLFDHVLATEGSTNLSARSKRNALVTAYGEGGFDYVGNSRDDLQIWGSARRAYLVDPEYGVEQAARKLGNVETVIRSPESKLKLWMKALRLHQWTKNLLIFVPLLASHQVGDLELLLGGLLAFFCFSLCASSVYLLNDLLDLEDDRHHPTKRERPFASGHLPLRAGLMLMPALLVGAFAGSLLLLPWQFAAVMGVYYLLTVAYSLSLKRIVMIDVITLGMLYTLRIIAGTFAFGVSATFWMLTFSMFLFQSLALVKRYAELRKARRKGDVGKTRGRGYFPSDLDMIASLGSASGYLSVLVLALYVQDDSTTALYRNPEVIWLTCPLLLFWISRMWLLTHRGQMHDDPVVFALKDRSSLLIAALFALTFWFAL